MISAPVPTLVIRRILNAPPERVYQAWTDPQIAAQFLRPDDIVMPEVEMDVRVGGLYHIVMQKPDGERLVARGTYREVRPAAHLSMSWKWDEDIPQEEHETLLTLDFAPHGTGTEFTLTHEKLASVQSRTNHQGGWNSILDKMEQL